MLKLKIRTKPGIGLKTNTHNGSLPALNPAALTETENPQKDRRDAEHGT